MRARATGLVLAAQILAALGAAMALSACSRPAPKPSPVLAWAYPEAAPAPLPEAPAGAQHVPGSKLTLTQAQVNDDANPPDWFPAEHPPAPAVVAHGRPDGPKPCAACHLFNGEGFIGAPSLAGLSAEYIAEQVHEFQSGRRVSSEAGRPATAEMIAVARKVSDPELARAAAYYAALPPQPWIRVVETPTVPATRPDHYGWRDLVPGGRREPIGNRIIEVPEDFARMTLEDPHSGIVAYVPPGSIARGEALVRSGHGGEPCNSCHAANLHGLGQAPPLAGRSPSYLARMLWDIKTGARGGPAVAAMQGPAGALSDADIVDVTAYLASLSP
jgi:cytochrome c553